MAWTVYNNGTKRTQYSTVPTSSVIAQSVVVDGVAVSNCDHAGITTTQSRQFTSTGMTLVQTDGRGNATTTVTDLAGRMVSVTDATNAATTTVYEATSDNPACITNAQGKTTCYRYDLRGQKVAEWGTAIQPACFGYDDADRLVSLTTFRANEADITTDPTERTDGDITTWSYDPASGQELCKTYADNSAITKTYDSFGRLATETNARGMVKTLSYVLTTGELSGMVWEDDAAHAQAFTYTLTGKLASVTDAAGMRTFTYNEYDELVSDSLTALDKSHLITEHRDEFGRSVGYDYKLNGIVQQSVNYGYGTDGRYSTAGFTHGGTNKQFQYGYFAGSNLLQTLTMPNGITLTQQYEQQRDLLTGMSYMRGETTVAERTYAYDTLGRPTSRTETREGDATRSDAFTHNDRSELTAATLGNAAYAYAYDNIGNRKSAQENAEEVTNYDTNNLNQYTAVGEFVPEFDADGNQTKVQTSTGIWNVTYDAENRPTVFSRANDDGTTTQVTCAYDYKGRRATKKVETLTTNAETGESSSAINLNHAYIYRGYLQITCFDLQPVPYPCLWFITWDSTQPVATRPLAIQKDGTWYTYGLDHTKNVCEIFGVNGYILTSYSYTPNGQMTSSGNVFQPIQWSSEYHDLELSVTYYNYRYYNCLYGFWLSVDPLSKYSNYVKSYIYNDNRYGLSDYLGLLSILYCRRFTWVYQATNNNRFTSMCQLIQIKPTKEGCCKCEKIRKALKIENNKNNIENLIFRLWDCLLSQQGSVLSNTLMIANTGAHDPASAKGDGRDRNQRLPEGWYRVLPGNSSTYGPNTPGITGIDKSVAGQPVTKPDGDPRKSVWIHRAWGNLSEGYETSGCLAMMNGMDLVVKEQMMDKDNCGGVYLKMEDIGVASPDQIELFKKMSEAATEGLVEAYRQGRTERKDWKTSDYSYPYIGGEN